MYTEMMTAGKMGMAAGVLFSPSVGDCICLMSTWSLHCTAARCSRATRSLSGKCARMLLQAVEAPGSPLCSVKHSMAAGQMRHNLPRPGLAAFQALPAPIKPSGFCSDLTNLAQHSMWKGLAPVSSALYETCSDAFAGARQAQITCVMPERCIMASGKQGENCSRVMRVERRKHLPHPCFLRHPQAGLQTNAMS